MISMCSQRLVSSSLSSAKRASTRSRATAVGPLYYNFTIMGFVHGKRKDNGDLIYSHVANMQSELVGYSVCVIDC